MQEWAVFLLISKHLFKTLISLVFSLWIINKFEKCTLIFAGLQQTKLRKLKSEFSIIIFHCLLKHEKLLLVLVPQNNFHYGLDKGHVYIITIADRIMILQLHWSDFRLLAVRRFS